MKKLALIASALVVALGLVAIVGFRFAGHCHGRDPAQVKAMVNEHVDDTLDDLKATPDQRTQIHAVVDKLLQDGEKLHGGHAAVHDEVLAQWKSDQPDAAKLRALVDERAKELRAFADEAIDAGVQVHGILTPDQRAQLTRKIERWHK